MHDIVFKKKLKELFVGKRTLKQRFSTAFFPALALPFILFFFGPIDLSYNAKNYLQYTVPEITPTCLVLWGVVFFSLFIVTWICGGKLHVWLSSLLTGLALAFYIQGNWLNIDLGPLDGTPVEWQNYGDNALVGLVIFSLIMLIPFLVRFFSRRLWRIFVCFISFLLVIMHVIPLGKILIEAYTLQASSDSTRLILSKDREFELGEENIVVFLLDATGPEEMTSLLERYPDVLRPFRDFQYFDNFSSVYVGTFPAAPYLLTHYPYDWTIPPDEWLKNAWNSEESNLFYSQMKQNGWDVNLFNKIPYVEGTLENAMGKISNIEVKEGAREFSVDLHVFRKLIKLSFYRYFPLIMKAPFWIYTDELSGMVRLSENEKAWDETDSIQKFLDKGISQGNSEKVYITYHYQGSHYPFRIKENGRRITTESPKEIGLQGQLAGHFYMISQYIQEMKDLHIYDNSTIIISSDHGNAYNTQSIFFIKPRWQRQEEMTVSHAPVSQAEFMETIAEAAGLTKGQFGRSVFDIPENEERERCTYVRWTDPSYPKIPGKTCNAIREFCYTGDNDLLYEMIVNKEFRGSYRINYPFY